MAIFTAFQLNFMTEKETKAKEETRSIGLKLMGKIVIKKLRKILTEGAEKWEVPLETIVMQMKLVNDEPKVIIKETHKGEKVHHLSDKLGDMEEIGKWAFRKLLRSTEVMAREWETDKEDLRLDMRFVNDKPEVIVQEESGQRRFIELTI